MSGNITWHAPVAQKEKRITVAGQRGMVLWLTGLSGSGKSTLACETENRLLDMGINACVLDGDNLRHGINANLGFDEKDREENIRRVAEVAALMASAEVVVLVSVISPYAEIRKKARDIIGAGSSFYEVYVKAGIETCKKRDPKGLYKKAEAGEIKEFTGVSAPYEPPERPDLIVDTEHGSLQDGVLKLLFTVAMEQQEHFYKKVVKKCVTAALEAGEAIMEIYRQDFEVEYKEDDSPLTLADKVSGIMISEMLYRHFPYFPVLSEEMADDEARLAQDFCFIVDPLDGTKEFIKKNGEFTVNIGLSYQGEPVAGVVYAPALGKLYYAARGLGAYGESTDRCSVSLFSGSSRIRVSNRTEQLVVMSSRSHSDTEQLLLLERNRQKIAEVRTSGSSLKGCLIAAGEADVYYRHGPTMEWDTCAMQAVVEEAGGVMLQGDGTPLRYNRKNSKNEKGFYILNRAENEFI